MKLSYLIASVFLLTGQLAQAQSINMGADGTAVELRYNSIDDKDDGLNINAGALYNGSSLNSLEEVGVSFKANDITGLSVAIGAKALVGTIFNYKRGTIYNESAITLGGEAKFTPPNNDRISVAGYYFGAPSTVTFGEASHAEHWGLYLDYEVDPGTKVYLEYRETSFYIKPVSQAVILDNGAFVGLKLAF